VISNQADATLIGRSLADVGKHEPRLGAFFVSFMDTVCAYMLSFGIVYVTIAWVALRRGQWWAFWTLVVSSLLVLPYYALIALPAVFALQGTQQTLQIPSRSTSLFRASKAPGNTCVHFVQASCPPYHGFFLRLDFLSVHASASFSGSASFASLLSCYHLTPTVELDNTARENASSTVIT